jgi:dTDP-4-dehydrorhamnose reductase
MTGELPEVWAGFECARVRVGDRIVDELELTGHDRRPRDLDRLAQAGIRAVRYPVLWERQRSAGGEIDLRWSDARLGRLRALGIAPIVTLLHHGTGMWGEILDDAFPAAFGAYAGTLARRYPWVRDWLPINEILTNARFCGLYGHWQPHGRDRATFAHVLANQLRAYREAARAIRAVIPDARIGVAEDLGTTTSTPELAHQATSDRARRWLVLDVLTGRGPEEPVWRWLREDPRGAAAVLDLVGDPEPPDLIGINRYLTSDRFLDHRRSRYPRAYWGGNGSEAYADIEMVRVAADGMPDWASVIAGVWGRYRRPVALTEVHLAGTAAERVAWWIDAWDGAVAAASTGIPVRGVTSWAAVGSWDWPSLLCRPVGLYEAGIWRQTPRGVRRTALFDAIARTAAGERLTPKPGWWKAPERLLYPPVEVDLAA